MPQRCLDRDIEISATRGRVEIRFAGRVIAQSIRGKDLREANYPVRIYVPEEDVEPGIFQPSGHQTSCPYKGEASYYHLASDSETAENAAWFYPDPCTLVEAIRGHVAFWGDQVQVRVFPA